MFKDHFSKQSAEYAKFRPGYPAELFAWLESLTPAHELAWDVGTGSGQAAVALADYFERVIATDPSAAQIANAQAHERVTYRIAAAEDCDLADRSVDLITIAQAIHWFDLPRFYAQAKRVLKPRGVLAAWTYYLNEVEPAIDTIVLRFYREIVGQYWPAERAIVESRYRDLPFPFTEIAAPALRMETYWSADDYIGYLRTWSSTQRFREARGSDPVALIESELRAAWGGELRSVNWPMHVRAGRVS